MVCASHVAFWGEREGTWWMFQWTFNRQLWHHQTAMTSDSYDIRQRWHQTAMTSDSNDIRQLWYQTAVTSDSNDIIWGVGKGGRKGGVCHRPSMQGAFTPLSLQNCTGWFECVPKIQNSESGLPVHHVISPLPFLYSLGTLDSWFPDFYKLKETCTLFNLYENFL